MLSGPTYFAMIIQSSVTEVHNYLLISTCDPLKYITNTLNLIVCVYMGKLIRVQRDQLSLSSITTRYSVNKFDEGFTVDVELEICILVQDRHVCFPNGQPIHLIENEHIPLCNLGQDGSEGIYCPASQECK